MMCVAFGTSQDEATFEIKLCIYQLVMSVSQLVEYQAN